MNWIFQRSCAAAIDRGKVTERAFCEVRHARFGLASNRMEISVPEHGADGGAHIWDNQSGIRGAG
jgi:hypothetical protein